MGDAPYKTGHIFEEHDLQDIELKEFADDKINVTQKLEFVLGRLEIIVGEGHQHFLLFSQCFQKVACTGSLKVLIVW